MIVLTVPNKGWLPEPIPIRGGKLMLCLRHVLNQTILHVALIKERERELMYSGKRERPGGLAFILNYYFVS